MMPENTVDALRTAMENGILFAVDTRARPEPGDGFVGDENKPMPMVTRVNLDESAQTISLAVNTATDTVEWIAKGKVIATGSSNLGDYADDISCYVRAQLKGEGGICFTQPFVCDDGNMQQTPVDDRSPLKKWFDDFLFTLFTNLARRSGKSV